MLAGRNACIDSRRCFGDTPPAEFRQQLHELADWIADFREHIERLRVAPNDKPGAVREQLPKRAPEKGEPFEKILTDVDNIIVPGMVHWSHPMFLGYFGATTTAGHSRRDAHRAAERERDDLAHFSGRDRAGDRRGRLAAAMGRFDGRIRRGGLRYRVSCHHARTGGRA